MDEKTTAELCVAFLLGCPDPHQKIAEMITGAVYSNANKRGFMRRVLMKQNLADGQLPLVKSTGAKRYAISAIKGSDTDVLSGVFCPPEFVLQYRAQLKKGDGAEAFDEMMVQLEEATYVTEDQLVFRTLMPPNTDVTSTQDALGTFDLLVKQASFVPLVLAVSSNVFSNLVSDRHAQERLILESDFENIKCGRLGTLKTEDGHCVALLSDAYRHPAHRVFEQKSMYLIADVLEAGLYTDRGYEGKPFVKKEGEKTVGAGVFINATLSVTINPDRYLRPKE